MQKEFGCVAMISASAIKVDAQPKALKLMQACPFGVCLELADRTLADVIAHEHTSTTTMAELKESACYMAEIIKSLHECGVVHAGVSPAHIVRLSPDSNELAVLDFSTSVATKIGPPRSPTPSAKRVRSDAHAADDLIGRSANSARGGSPTSFALASTGQDGEERNSSSRSTQQTALIGAKTGYTSPEFAMWAETQATKQNRSSIGAVELPRTLPRVRSLVDLDIWGLGLCLFELYAGRALLAHTRGVACLASQDRLQVWNGFDPDELDEIEHRYGIAASASLIDLLQYLCEVNPDDRPNSMKEVLEHVFYDSIKGAMRPGEASTWIRRQLNVLDHCGSINGTVLVVYAERDSAFVHNRLALKLAKEVKSLLLERLDLTADGRLPAWDADRSSRNVQKADVVVTIISSGFASSKNVGFTMGNIAKKNKVSAGTGGSSNSNSNSNIDSNSDSNSMLPVVSVMLATSETSEQTNAAGWPFDKVGGISIPQETWGKLNPIKCRADASDELFDIVVKRLLFSICKANPDVAATQPPPPRARPPSSHANRRSVKVAPAPTTMPPMAVAMPPPPMQRSPSFKRRNNNNNIINTHDSNSNAAPSRKASFRQRNQESPSPVSMVDDAKNIESIA